MRSQIVIPQMKIPLFLLERIEGLWVSFFEATLKLQLEPG